METYKEAYVEKHPLPFSIEETEEILEQMKNSICKIYNNNKKGSGFFCKIPYSG